MMGLNIGGIYRHKKQQSHHKDSYRVTASGSKAVAWMKILKPYMSKRRQSQIEKALLTYIKGSTNKKYKIQDEDISKILEMRKQGMTQSAIATHFNVSREQINRICKNKRKVSSQQFGCEYIVILV